MLFWEGWKVEGSRVTVRHLNTHHKEKLLVMGECRDNLILAFMRESKSPWACNFDFSCRGNENSVQVKSSRML